MSGLHGGEDASGCRSASFMSSSLFPAAIPSCYCITKYYVKRECKTRRGSMDASDVFCLIAAGCVVCRRLSLCYTGARGHQSDGRAL